MSIQRHEEKSAPAHSRERDLWLLFLYVFFFFPLGLPYAYWTWPGVLGLLPEVLTLVLGPSFVLFLQAFPFLIF